MAILIINDDQQHELETKPGETVLELLLKAQQNHWDENMMIDALQVNGEDVTLDEEVLRGLSGENVEMKITLVEAPTPDLEKIVADSIKYLERLGAGFIELSGKIRINNDQASYKSLSDGISGLSTVLELLEALRTLDGVPDELNDQFHNFLSDLNEKSEELNDAQVSKDPTLIADILEYEFADSVEELKSFLNRFSEYI